MSTEIENDAAAALSALATWSEVDGDPIQGRYEVNRDELSSTLNLPLGRIVDAVEIFHNSGFVDRIVTLGGLQRCWLTPAGRLEYQRMVSGNGQTQGVSEASGEEYDIFLSHSSLDDDPTEVLLPP